MATLRRRRADRLVTMSLLHASSRVASRVLAAIVALSVLPVVGKAQAAVTNGGLATGAHQIVVDGVRFWYRVAGATGGAAAPVVFLHGGPGYNSESFAVLEGPRLERSLRMVYYDQRGSGRSERPWNGEYSLPRMVEDVEGLRRALGVPRIALIGHSFGGTLALEYAARYPEHVSRVVLVGAAADIPAACQARVAFLAMHYAGDLARARADTAGKHARGDCDLAFNTVPDSIRGRVNDETMFPDSILAHRQDSVDAASGLRNTGELSNALFNHGLLTYRFDAPARLTMPVLVVAGHQDYAIGLPQQRALAAALPHARLTEYEHAGHFVYLDEPERFTQEVTRFLTDGAPPGRR